MRKSFSVATLGCKVNQYESAAITSALIQAGYSYVPFKSRADLYVINTCTVTANTEFQSRQLIRRAIRLNPGADVVITGCYAETNPEALRQIDGVKWIIGNREKPMLVEKIEGSLGEISAPPIWPAYFPPPAILPGRTRPCLKIEDGCDSYCSYCIVPYARGPVRSLPPVDVLRHLSILIRWGFKEIVLTGIHLGAYGKDLPSPCDLESLLAEILNHLPKGIRLRLSSLEPLEVSYRLLSLMAKNKKICPHLHLPIQSGDDEILKRMNRAYTGQFIRNLVREILAVCPDMAIGMDVMVGFPGETEASFNRTYKLLTELPIAYLHVFPYSRRAGTEAALFSQQVPEGEKKRRVALLRELDQKKRKAFMTRFLKKPLEVILEERRDKRTGSMMGLAPQYFPVAVSRTTEKDVNSLLTVIPTGIDGGIMRGEVVL